MSDLLHYVLQFACAVPKSDASLCNDIVESHKLMISAGHPPFAPVEKDWLVVDEDKWEHLRTPPLILRRELIQNWNYINVQLPKHRDRDELIAKEKESEAVYRNEVMDSEQRSKSYNPI